MTYDDLGLSVTTRRDQTSTGDNALTTTTFYDPLGRARLIDSGVSRVQKAYRYGNATSYELTSNPYAAASSNNSEATMGWTLMTRDLMGRITSVDHYAGGSAPGAPTNPPFITYPAWGGATTKTGTAATLYNGTTTTVTDEAGNSRVSGVDGLGRLTSVQEANGNTTSYTYDGLDNLIGVSQPGRSYCHLPLGQVGSPWVWFSRCFSYDSLKRLRSTENPESGTISYAYDGRGNLIQKLDYIGNITCLGDGPSNGACPGTATLKPAYDGLNRPRSKTYSVTAATAPTSAVSYSYDQDTKGTLSSVASTNNATAYTHDKLGRVTGSAQTIAGVPYPPISYRYSLSNQLTSMTYPSGRVVSYGFDSADRTLSATGALGGQSTPYIASGFPISYTASGSVSSLTLGNGVTESWTYNRRMQPLALAAAKGGSTPLLAIANTYCPGGSADCATTAINGNNGNVLRQSIAINSSTPQYSQTFVYDNLNRLSIASEISSGSTTWSETFGYDDAGNRWVSTTTPAGLETAFTPTVSTNFDTGNHLMVNNASYDSAGNQKVIGGYAFTYDAENRLTSSTIGGIAATYTYDGDGRRVTKTIPSATTAYVYDAFGQIAAEYSTAANPVAGTQYLTADSLGSTRLVTNASGVAVACHDYLPFGEEIQASLGARPSCYSGSDGVVRKFSGKERDSETNLDYFGTRYFSGAQGRFTSPDPGPYKLEDPQTFNRYAYVNNNPLKYVDPTGREAEYVVDEKNKMIMLHASITIYGPNATAAYAGKLKSAMEGAWKGNYKDPSTGTVYKVSTTADVSVYNPMLGVGLSAQNAFYVGSDVSRSSFEYRHTDPRFPLRYAGDPGVYTGAINPAAGVERHETGHVLGEPDDYWEDSIRGTTGPQPGHAGHLMAGSNSSSAAQDEINRIGSFTLNQMQTTHKSGGTIIRLPEPPRPR